MNTLAVVLCVLACALGAHGANSTSVGIGPNAPKVLKTAKNNTDLSKPARNTFYLCPKVWNRFDVSPTVESPCMRGILAVV